MAQKCVLIFGGTGIISSEVCKCAINSGYDVTVVNRGKRKDFFDKRARLIIADIRTESKENIITKLQDVSYEIVIDFLTFDTDQLDKMLYIIKNKCRQYIFVSTATVYKEQEHGHIYKESDDIGNMLWDYCAKKSECEQKLAQVADSLNLHYTIVRPYVTYGMTRLPYQFAPIEYYSIINRVQNEKAIPICGINTICTVTKASDFAVGVVGLIENPKAYGEAVHITADNTTTWKHIISLLGEKLNKKVTFVDIDKKWLSNQKNYYIDISEIVGDKSRDMIFDNTKIKTLVPEFDGSSTIEDNIDEILKYYKADEHKQINYLWEGNMDRLIASFAKHNNTRITLPFISDGGLKDFIRYCVGRSSILYRAGRKIKGIRK